MAELASMASEPRRIAVAAGWSQDRPRPVDVPLLAGILGLDLLILESLVRRAIVVFRTSESAGTWLRSPLDALDGKTPLDILSGPGGLARVSTLLGRIEHGVYG